MSGTEPGIAVEPDAVLRCDRCGVVLLIVDDAGSPRLPAELATKVDGHQCKPVAIDPPGCGCTECMVGEYVPLDRATPDQVRRMVAGKLADNTDGGWTASRRVEFVYHGVVLHQWDE